MKRESQLNRETVSMNMEEKSAEQTDEDQRLHSSIHITTLNNTSEQR